MVSKADRQVTSRRQAKPPCRFRDRGSAPLMAAGGWKGEGLLCRQPVFLSICAGLAENLRPEVCTID